MDMVTPASPPDKAQDVGPDAEKAADFLDAIAAGGLVAVSAIVPDGAIESRVFHTGRVRADLVRWIGGRLGITNLYFTLNEPRPGATGKLREDDVAAFRGVADIDPDKRVAAEPGGFARERQRLWKRAHEQVSA